MLVEDENSVRSRRGAREMLVQALYQWQLADHSETEIRKQFACRPEFDRIDQTYFKDLLSTILSNVQRLDDVVGKCADREVSQLDEVSRAVLLLAAAELTERSDIPTKVSINEAVELAKRYGPKDCFRFVNAVLDRLAKEARKPRLN
mgnify:CR=1 FL=1|jgi:N utilization substance protein B